MQLVSGLSQLQANGSTLTSGSNQLAGVLNKFPLVHNNWQMEVQV